MRGWSKTMPAIALSTGESELGAVARGVAEGMGLRSILEDFGLSVKMLMRSDASAAIGITQLGLGKVRHLSVADLWIQQRVRKKDLEITKVRGEGNPSDLMTKALDGPRIAKLLSAMGLARPSDAQDGPVQDDDLEESSAVVDVSRQKQCAS